MRRFALAGAAAFLAATTASALAVSPATLLPRAGCDVVGDPAGDASIAVERNAHNWDITGVSYRMSASTFSVMIRVPELQDGMARGGGDTWDAGFTVRGRKVGLQASRLFATLPRLQQQYFGRNMGLDPDVLLTVDGVKMALRPGAQFNLGAHFVILSVDRVALEKLVGGTLDTLTGLTVKSSTRVVTTVAVLDEAAAPATTVVKATDNTCFV